MHVKRLTHKMNFTICHDTLLVVTLSLVHDNYGVLPSVTVLSRLKSRVEPSKDRVLSPFYKVEGGEVTNVETRSDALTNSKLSVGLSTWIKLWTTYQLDDFFF